MEANQERMLCQAIETGRCTTVARHAAYALIQDDV